MTEYAQNKPDPIVKAAGISFRLPIWDRLEAENAKLERPNRSLIVERALTAYFEALDAKNERTEGAA